jgi:hypothetical protein
MKGEAVAIGEEDIALQLKVGTDSSARFNRRDTGEEDFDSVTFELGFNRHWGDLKSQISKVS